MADLSNSKVDAVEKTELFGSSSKQVRLKLTGKSHKSFILVRINTGKQTYIYVHTQIWYDSYVTLLKE